VPLISLAFRESRNLSTKSATIVADFVDKFRIFQESEIS